MKYKKYNGFNYNTKLSKIYTNKIRKIVLTYHLVGGYRNV